MALNYDFDMVSATPNAFADRALADGPRTGKAVAMFRDPLTVAALGRAPQAMQDYLRASHFGTGTHHSGAPAGHYPQADEAARITVIEALAENVARFDLPAADDIQPVGEDFHLPALFAALAEAEPVHVDPAPEVQPVVMDLTERPEALCAAATVCDAALSVDPAIADSSADEAIHADTISAEAHPAEADATATQPPARRRFRLPALPSLPRWLTAGAALTVLGVAVGTAMI